MSGRLAFQTQLASIMEVLANAAVAEICKLVEDDYAVVSLQMSQCQRENKALKRKLHLLELKMARGNAERRLRESGLNGGGRARVQIHGGPQESSSRPDAAFERSLDVPVWSGRSAPRTSTAEMVLSESLQRKSPGVEVVEEVVEALVVKEEQQQEDGGLLGDGVLELLPCKAAAQRPRLEHQNSQSTCSQSQSQNQNQNQSQNQSSISQLSSSSRGVEKDEDPDVVLVKVEEADPVPGPPAGLSIQEGLVESSTDDYRGALPLDDTAQASANQLCDQQDCGRGFSEVSFGHSSLWTNGGGSFDGVLPGPSSHCAPLSYLPGSVLGPEPGGSGRGPERPAERDPARGFPAFPFEPNVPVIDLSEDSGPGRASGPMQPSVQVPQPFLDPGPGPGPKGLMKRVYICSFCGKQFPAPANLESHLRTHTGERPYGCVVCGKKFSQFWNLKIHRNIHTGERPYRCPLCSESFSDPSNLKKHQKRHHPPDGGLQPGRP